jgi:hypothetical protein
MLGPNLVGKPVEMPMRTILMWDLEKGHLATKEPLNQKHSLA